MADLSLETLDPAPVPPALDCWYLSGPTAAGKTKVGVELALRLNAEIVSLDSMSLYQDMNIGTAKPSAEDRARVPHHLLNVVPPSEEFSLSEYIDAAHAAIGDIKSRGREVLFVGGTPLYLKALLRGVYQGPPADWTFRAQIEKELETVPLAALHERLQVIDPLLAAKLHPNDKRRIVRALEVFKLTGQRLSHLQTQFDEGRLSNTSKVFVLAWPREALHQRIDARVEQMFAAGLVQEVRGLLATYGTLSRTARQAVGYREVVELLKDQEDIDVGWVKRSADPSEQTVDAAWVGGGRLDPPYNRCVERVKARTRQFARRQETWFRALSECRFVMMDDPKSPADVAIEILRQAEWPRINADDTD
jgi:tRNA dimethylallyltransferase